MKNMVSRVVSGSSQQKTSGTSVKLWNIHSGDLIADFTGHEQAILTVNINWDGKYAVTGSADTTLKLWEVATGRLLHTFRGHTGSVCSVYFSRDGKYIISGSTDGTAKLWLLDWELQNQTRENWQEEIRPYLENFLFLHTPLTTLLSPGKQLSFLDKKNALTRQGKPTWTDNDFNSLLYNLGCAGYGWLKPEEVIKQLKSIK
jgi:WD40 repeat protein